MAHGAGDNVIATAKAQPTMEIITIDSSDDENSPPTQDSRLITPRHFEIASSAASQNARFANLPASSMSSGNEDKALIKNNIQATSTLNANAVEVDVEESSDGSISSSDSILQPIFITKLVDQSRNQSVTSQAQNIPSDSIHRFSLDQRVDSDNSSISSDDSVFKVTGMGQKMQSTYLSETTILANSMSGQKTQIRQENKCDDSSVSSHDSIFEATGMEQKKQSTHLLDMHVQIKPQRESESGSDDNSASSHDSILEGIDIEQKMRLMHLSDNSTMVKSNTPMKLQDKHTWQEDKFVYIKDQKSVKCHDGSVSSDTSIYDDTGLDHSMQCTRLTHKSTQIQEQQTKDDDSSVSSNDSILNATGMGLKNKPSRMSTTEKRIQIREHLVSENDDSSISSDDAILKPSGLKHKMQTTHSSHKSAEIKTTSHQNNLIRRDSNRDDSSVSSDDSILKATGFERRKHSIHSYYDFCKYYPNNMKRDATADRDNGKPSRNRTIHLPSEMPLPNNAEWSIVLLMDHREFGCSNNFLSTVETQINNYFGGKHAEITTLPSADYLYVARLISTAKENAGEILEERVLDLLIERKAVQDVCQCLITDSKKYKPLSFFEAQMYKLMNCGMDKKLFVMEGDEDKTKGLMHGAKNQSERERRLKRVKTLRLQLANGEFEGVELICTKSRHDTVKFLIHQLKCLQESFDPRHPPLKTRESLKNYINRQMKSPTFLEYLRLRSIPSIGDVKAMKVILDPNLDWDKRFLSPASSKKSKACLDDKAIFWKPTASSKTNKDAKIKAPPVIKQSENDTPYNPYSCKPKANITCEKNKSNARAHTTSSTKIDRTKITSFFNKDSTDRSDSVAAI